MRLVKKDGPRQVNEPIPVAPLIFPDTAYPRSSLLALRPGEIGGLTITWENWCDPLIEGKPRVPPSAVRITLPGGGGALDADYNAVPPCIDPSSPSTIGVSPFEPAKISRVKPWTNAVVRATVPGQPLHARRGEILRFRVVLRNTSRSTLRFDRCPAYVQQLVPRGEVEVYEFNCARAHAIAPRTERGVRDADPRAEVGAARRQRALLGPRPVRGEPLAGPRARDDRRLTTNPSRVLSRVCFRKLPSLRIAAMRTAEGAFGVWSGLVTALSLRPFASSRMRSAGSAAVRADVETRQAEGSVGA